MPLLRTTFIYQLNRYSFTESWFREVSGADPKAEATVAKTYAVARAAISGANTVCIAIRVSNVDDRRQKAYLEYVSFPGNRQVDGQGNPLHPSAATNVALNMAFQNIDNTQEKLIQLRGCWDEIEFQGGQFAFNDPLYVPLIQAYGAKVVELKYGWQYSQTKRTSTILGINQNANGTLDFTFGAAAGGGGVATMFTATEVADNKNVPIRLSNMIDSKNLNGQLVVRVTGVSSATSIRPIAIRPYVGDGVAARYVKALAEARDGRVQRVGNRQAGAPLLLSAGRGPVRARG